MSKDQLQQYSELAGKELEVGTFMTYIMKYMMDKGLSLQNTEGMIEASVFPVNYFTLKQVRAVSRVAECIWLHFCGRSGPTTWRRELWCCRLGSDRKKHGSFCARRLVLEDVFQRAKP